MIYTAHNARGASVWDVEGRTELKRIQSVDTDRGIVRQIVEPVRVNGKSEVISRAVRFRTIYPLANRGIRGPLLFHCYGPKN